MSQKAAAFNPNFDTLNDYEDTSIIDQGFQVLSSKK